MDSASAGKTASTGKRSRQRRRVVWDEENLARNEETKTPKQKITEPKTPYHTLSSDPDEGPGSDSEAGRSAVNPDQVRSALTEIASSSRAAADSEGSSGGGRRGGWTSSEDEGDQSLEFEKWMEDRAKEAAAGQPSVSFHGSEDYYGSAKESTKAFREHRKRHYDEYRKLKQLRGQEKKDLEGEDVEVNGEGGQGAASSAQKEPGEQEYWGGTESDGEGKKGGKALLGQGDDKSSDGEPMMASPGGPPAAGRGLKVNCVPEADEASDAKEAMEAEPKQ